MSIEYLVVQAVAEDGAFGRIQAPRLNKSWPTLQEPLDELGQHGPPGGKLRQDPIET